MKSRERHRRLGELFLAVCDLPEGVQAEIVDQFDSSDESLKSDLWAMLREHRLAETTAQLETTPIDLLGPGTIVGERYRIVTPLGQGGMGVVYRADDLLLGQTVALKFVASGYGDQPRWLDLLRQETLYARRVTHPNVCRIFDLVQADGHTFVTMEYVDGEDLESLLQRLGRLPSEKALAVGWELCLGLSAIHAAGLLHRDLKPSNVMIDGRGRVRIADFGIASLITPDSYAERRAGTPAYMAPEQLAGAAAHIRSDLYALGLVLYELFTGRSIHGASAHRISHGPLAKPPVDPCHLVEELDSKTGRAILHCLELAPERRPALALAVAAELTGRSILGATLAAGETPTPELVATAQRERLAPRPARLALAGVLAGLFLSLVLSSKTSLMTIIPFDKPPEVLAEKARDVLRLAGASGPVADQAWGLQCDWVSLRQVIRDRPQGAPPLERSALGRFWYREGTTPFFSYHREGRVDWQIPHRFEPGMRSVLLDPFGRLRGLAVVPQGEQTSGLPPPDYVPLFEAAGLDFRRFSPATPRTTPPIFADSRLAWVGPTPDRTGEAVEVEAASLAGRPVSFTVRAPWEREAEAPQLRHSLLAQRLAWKPSLQISLRAILLFSAVFLAAHQLRTGRGDRRGAGRLAVFTFIAGTIAWSLQAHHVATVEPEYELILQGLSQRLLEAALTWLIYIAAEPEVRRLWPETEISWSRLLAGRWNDRLVASHFLIGAFCGISQVLIVQAGRLISWFQGTPLYVPEASELIEQLGLQTPVATLLRVLLTTLMIAMSSLSTLVLAVRLLRSRTLAVVVCTPLFVALMSDWQQLSVLSCIAGFAIAFIHIYVLIKWGVFAAIVAVYVRYSLRYLPVTPNLQVWYGHSTLLVVGLLAGLAVAAYYLSQKPESEEHSLLNLA